jgi:hypothetical protein
MGREGRDLSTLTCTLTALTLASVSRSAHAEPPARPAPAPAPAPEEELSAEDRALLDVIELLWEMPLLEEWDPEEDAPHPIVDEAISPRAPDVDAPEVKP